MEVHHHPHVEKKSFAAYFLEFLMIFLAVTMGFFAENIRESITESKHVHEYMKSMVSDLQSDLVMYDSCQKYNYYSCGMIDSIITSLKRKKGNMASVYYMARRITMGSSLISPNAKTFEQMKSTSGFGLIHNQSTADNIANYYQLTKRFDYWSELQRQRINDLLVVNDKIFDASVFFLIIKNVEKETPGQIIASLGNPPLVNSDPSTINTVLMRYQYYYGILKLNSQRAVDGATEAKNLIALLKKEYDLKNEQ
jgi:hypothetical protein